MNDKWTVFDVDDDILFESNNLKGIVEHLTKGLLANMVLIEDEKKHIRVIRYIEFL